MTCAAQTITIASPSTRSKELALSARKLLEDLKELEVGMGASNGWQQCSRRKPSVPPSPSHKQSLLCRNSKSETPSRYQTLFSCRSFLDHSTSVALRDCTGKKHVSGAFVTFCEHLLYMNHVWKRERQLRTLQASIQALEKAKCSNAFKAFCDRLLLSNRIWQLERQIQEIAAEGERNKRARVAAISRAAQQMAVDVRKEAMIEELVMELMQELRESKDAMKEEHEREIRVIQSDWLKEYRRLARQNEQMRLERHARLIEQEISNEVEQSLSNALERSHQRIQELEFGDGDSTLLGDAFDQGSVLWSGSSSSVDATEVEDMEDLEADEGMSTMSSATCVSVDKLPNWSTKSAVLPRRQRHSTGVSSELQDTTKKGLSRRKSMPSRKLDTTPYAGFSFNPLFFGNPETLVVSPSRLESIETPVKVAFKLGSSSALSSRRRIDSITRTSRLVGPTGQREPWRF